MIGWLLLGLVAALTVYSICKYVEYLNRSKLKQLVDEAKNELCQKDVFKYFEDQIARVEEVGVSQVKVKFYAGEECKAVLDVNTDCVEKDIYVNSVF